MSTTMVHQLGLRRQYNRLYWGISFISLCVFLVLTTWMSAVDHRWWYYVGLAAIATPGLLVFLPGSPRRLEHKGHARWANPREYPDVPTVDAPGAATLPSTTATPQTERPEACARYSVLLSITTPSSGPELLRVAQSLSPPDHLHLTALHIWSSQAYRAEAFSFRDASPHTHPLQPLLTQVDPNRVTPLCLVSEDPAQDYLLTISEQRTDLVVADWYEPVTSEAFLPPLLQTVVDHSPAGLVLYLSRRRVPWRRVLVPLLGSSRDHEAATLALQMNKASGIGVTFLMFDPADKDRFSYLLHEPTASEVRLNVRILSSDDPVAFTIQEAWHGYDLIVLGSGERTSLSPPSTHALFADFHERLAYATPTSLLLVHQLPHHQLPHHQRVT